MRIKKLAASIGACTAATIAISPSAHADGPWNLGLFSSAGSFSSAYEACEYLARDWASRQAVFYEGFALHFMSGASWATFGSTGAKCQAQGRSGATLVESIELSIFYNGNRALDPFDPANCDLFTESGACYVRNHDLNLGAPTVAQQDGCDQKRGPSLGVGNPINLATGNKYQREVDVAFAGAYTSLSLVRHYNSQDERTGVFGKSWSSDIDSNIELVRIYASQNPAAGATPEKTLRVVTAADGKRYEFEQKTAGWVATSNIAASLTETNSGFTFVDNSNIAHVFDTAGKLQKVTRQDGISTHYTYVDGRIESIEDDFGNRLSFLHNANGTIRTATAPGFGVFNYGYDAHLLKTITFTSSQDDSKSTNRTYFYEDPNSSHLLTGIEDEKGERFATWGYDAKGRATSSEHGTSGAESISIEYESRINTKVTNALGKEKLYTYIDIYGVKQILHVEDRASVNCPASDMHYTYDGRGFLKTITDGKNSVTHFERNERGLPTLEERGMAWTAGIGSDIAETNVSQAITREWHDTFDLPVIVTVRGKNAEGVWQDYRREAYKYDQYSRLDEMSITDLTAFTEPYITAGRTRTWDHNYTYYPNTAKVQVYSVNGPRMPANIMDEVDDITTRNFDQNGRLTSHVNALDHTSSFSDFDALGNPRNIIDSNDVHTTVTFDAFGYLDKVTVATDKGDAVTDYNYHPNGVLENIIFPDQTSVTYERNAARHLTAIQNVYGERMEFTPLLLNGEWKDRTIKDVSGRASQTATRIHDELGRIIGLQGNDGQDTVLRYDANSRLEDIDEMGHEALGTLETRHAYDALGRLEQTTDAASGITQFGYDGQDKLTFVQDANMHKTAYVVDGFGEVIREISPDRGTLDYRYDAAGNLVEITDGRNILTTMKYDAISRVRERTVGTQQATQWVYDMTDQKHANSQGRLSYVDGPSQEIHYAYTDLGQVEKETRTITIPDATPLTTVTGYGYDLAGNLTSVSYPGGHTVNYERPLGRVDSVTINSSAVQTLLSGVRYEPFGSVRNYRFGNGLTYVKSRDTDGRVDAITLGGDAERLIGHNFSYDAFNNVESIEITEDENRSETFEYNALHQLDWASGIYGDIDYDYDPVGNRTFRSISRGDLPLYTEMYIFPWDNNRLEKVISNDGAGSKERIFGYDDSGNITSVSGSNGLILDHNEEGRLQSVTPMSAN